MIPGLDVLALLLPQTINPRHTAAANGAAAVAGCGLWTLALKGKESMGACKDTHPNISRTMRADSPMYLSTMALDTTYGAGQVEHDHNSRCTRKSKLDYHRCTTCILCC